MKKTWEKTWGLFEDGDWSRLTAEDLRQKIAAGWDPLAKGNEREETVLNQAAYKCKDPQVIKLLLKYKKQDLSVAATYAACNDSYRKILPLLIRAGANIRKKSTYSNICANDILLRKAGKQKTRS